jgi:hypothetical protein
MAVKLIRYFFIVIILTFAIAACGAVTPFPTAAPTESSTATSKPQPTLVIEVSPIPPTPDSYTISLHDECRKIVDGTYLLRKDLVLPEKFSSETPFRKDFDFDPNQYFQIFTHLSVEENYTLDYIYYKDWLGGLPLIYARETNFPPFQSFIELLASYGEDISDTGLIVYTNLPHQHEFMDKIQIDKTPESYFEFNVFSFLSGQFYLWQRGLYNDEKILCDASDIKYLHDDVRSYRLELPQKLEVLIKQLDLSPSATINESTISIGYFTFTKWSGLYEEKVVIDKENPMHILDYSYKHLFEYYSGIEFEPKE